MPKMTLKQLVYFVAAADTKSIAAAALESNISQPSVSSAILKLERLLGVDLFVRHHAQGVSLTPCGQELLPKARELLARAKAFENQANAHADEPTGVLKIGCYLTLSPLFVPTLIEEISHAYPNIDLQFVEDTEDQLIRLLTSGEIDLAICYDTNLPKEVMSRQLKSVVPYVLLPADHVKSDENEISLAELIEEPFILLDTMPGRDYFLRIFAEQGLEPNIVSRPNSFEVVRGLVGRGVGYSILIMRPPSDMAYNGQPVVHMPIAGNIPRAGISLVQLPGARSTKVTSIFYETCQKIAADIDFRV